MGQLKKNDLAKQMTPEELKIHEWRWDLRDLEYRKNLKGYVVDYKVGEPS